MIEHKLNDSNKLAKFLLQLNPNNNNRKLYQNAAKALHTANIPYQLAVLGSA